MKVLHELRSYTERVNKDTCMSWGILALGAIILIALITATSIATKQLWLWVISLFVPSIMAPSAGTLIGPLLAPIAVCSGVLIAILTFSRDREKHAREREENRSEILLQHAKEGLDEVLKLLGDKNNDRVIWVRAARVLLEATGLGAQIKAPEYKKAFKLYEDKIRSQLYTTLATYNEATHKWAPLPPQFFYGLADWSRAISLDDAARETSSKTEVYGVSIDSVIPQTVISPISPHSIVAIFDFLEYPSDYSDPLEKVEIWNDGWMSKHGPSQGARRYVAHKKSIFAIGGKLHKRADGSGDSI